MRDAVVRFNAEGLAGLVDRSAGHRPERLGEQAMPVHAVPQEALRRWGADIVTAVPALRAVA